MSAISNNILTVTEPTIELEELAIPDIESEDAKNKNGKSDKNLSKISGSLFPLIRINGFDFAKDEIEYFKMTVGEEFLPTLTLILRDDKGIFSINNYPTDGDVINIYIRSEDEEIYKPIRVDFDIININSDGAEGGGGIYSFEGRLKVPSLFKELNIAFDKNTSYNHFIDAATQLKLGFATNVSNTDDSMIRIIPYSDYYNFFKDTTITAYKSDNHFFDSYIDLYYYLNLVDINNQLQYDEELEDTLIGISLGTNSDSSFEDVKTTQMGKLYLTNNKEIANGTNIFISSYSLENNSAEVTLTSGYSQIFQYYDDVTRNFLEFEIHPLISDNLPSHLFPLRGKMNENRNEEEVKYIYLGKQSKNVHSNFLFSKVHNRKNKLELNKQFLNIQLSQANMALYTMQKIPIIIVEDDLQKSNRIQVLNNEFSDNLDTLNKTVNNDYLTGIYVIGSIEYIYQEGDNNIKQNIKMYRREWPLKKS